MAASISDVVTGLWPNVPSTVEKLSGGITNSNYKVAVGDEIFVVRVAGDRTVLLGIDRQSEVAAGRLAAALGIAPEVVLADFPQGVIVTRFIVGRPVEPGEVGSEPVLADIAAALKSIHNAGSVTATFDAYKIVPRYYELAAADGVAPPFDFARMAATLGKISRVRPWRGEALCHNDLLNSNLIHDGAVRIVDWEYAGMGDPFFDLGNLAVNHGFSKEEDAGLLGHYFGQVTEADLALLALFKLVSEAREAMWGVLQLALSSLDVDFAAYARQHAEGYFRLLADLDFERTLSVASARRPGPSDPQA
ncbi:MAG TPA: phosphotransferase [Acidimicrobiales bacterium]|nr:phosphotransferase [Acidimicrobiales bacterium]